MIRAAAHTTPQLQAILHGSSARLRTPRGGRSMATPEAATFDAIRKVAAKLEKDSGTESRRVGTTVLRVAQLDSEHLTYETWGQLKQQFRKAFTFMEFTTGWELELDTILSLLIFRYVSYNTCLLTCPLTFPPPPPPLPRSPHAGTPSGARTRRTETVCTTLSTARTGGRRHSASCARCTFRIPLHPRS